MLKGVVGLVTGGASGLGRGTVERLVKEGAKVTVCDLKTSKGSEVVEEMARGNDVQFVPGDVTEEKDVAHALNLTKEKFGRLDVVVNCAGISRAFQVYNFNKMKPHMTEDFIKVQMVNSVGTFNVIRLAVGLMSENEPTDDGQRGVIINTASTAAFEGTKGQTAFASSKGAVASMTVPIARDLASHGIRCNTIAPGLFDTPVIGFLPDKVRTFLGRITPSPSRFGNPEEYADLVQHIITNKMINGETIRLDGALRIEI